MAQIKHWSVSIYILGWLLIGQTKIWGGNCDHSWLHSANMELNKMLLAYSPISALNYADSINNIIKNQNLEACPDALWILYNRGEALELHNRFQEALKEYYFLSTQAKLLKDFELMASCHISIARCMETIGRKADCLRHLLISKNIIESNKLWSLNSFLWVRYSSYHRIYESLDSSFYYANLAAQNSEIYKNIRQAADANMLIGMLTPKKDSSAQYFWKAKNYFISNNNYDGASYMAMSIYNCHQKYHLKLPLGNWLDTMANYLNQIQEYNPSYHMLMSIYYETRSANFEINHQSDSAYSYSKLANNHLKLSKTDINHAEISQSEIDFLIREEKKKSDSLLKQSNLQKIAIAILGLCLLIIIGMFYSNHLKRRKIEQQKLFIQNQNQELNKSLERQNLLLSEVHHRVKNNLQLVISLLALHYNKKKNNSEFQFLEEIANKIRSIALIHEHLYNSGEFERIELGSYIKELLEHYLALHTSALKFEYHLESDSPIYLNLETTMPIGIICTELISNSLKYARREEVTLLLEFKLYALENKYILKYQDNGVFPSVKSSNKEGMGTMLIDSMVRQLQAQSSSSAFGTSSFNLIFQEKKVSAV
ncbi:MAG: sensor histidine kinase [Saprospiraceae bacterium]|nr:sensor histidine kinase [Saprospiraceae bacterium]